MKTITKNGHTRAKKVLLLKLVALTAYIMLVNSYALFAVYPAVKQHQARLSVVLIIYVGLALPALIYALRRSQRFNRQQLVLGAGLVAVAVVIRLALGGAESGVALVLGSTLVYLLTGLVEETLWRGLLWQMIHKRSGSDKKTLIWVTLHFALLHVPFAWLRMANPLLFAGKVLALGVALGAVRLAAGNAKLPATVHAAVNILAKT